MCFEELILQRSRAGAISKAWHAGRYDRTLLGIFQVGDLTSVVEEAGAEVVILEEPEHLTWYHHGPRWTEKFSHVVSTDPAHDRAGFHPVPLSNSCFLNLPRCCNFSASSTMQHPQQQCIAFRACYCRLVLPLRVISCGIN